jgi:hypothetical protein
VCRGNMRLRSITFGNFVRRIKRQACPFATHPMQGGDTLWALRKLRREAPNAQFVFISERGACGPSPGKILSGVLQSGHNVCSLAQYVEKLWRSCWTACAGRETVSTEKNSHEGRLR